MLLSLTEEAGSSPPTHPQILEVEFPPQMAIELSLFAQVVRLRHEKNRGDDDSAKGGIKRLFFRNDLGVAFTLTFQPVLFNFLRDIREPRK